MIKIFGALIIVVTFVCIGYFLSERAKNRLRYVSALASFVDYVSVNIQVYRTPLDEIYSSFTDDFLSSRGFVPNSEKSLYEAAKESGLLSGTEEDEVFRAFGEKIGCGTVDDMKKLCTFTCTRLRSIEEKIRCELPDKQRIYRTVSLLAGISVVIMFI